jgi:hypothetical protein
VRELRTWQKLILACVLCLALVGAIVLVVKALS